MAAQFPSFESRTVTIDGINIHYVCGGSGPPLVLVHGLGSSAAVEFYYNLEPLAAHHRVLAIDLPGFGKSDKPVLEYTIELFVKAVRDLMTSEGVERAAVMGVSMGGRVALGLALDSPQLVERLVLVDALGVGAWPVISAGLKAMPLARTIAFASVLRMCTGKCVWEWSSVGGIVILQERLPPWGRRTSRAARSKIGCMARG